jgi:flagellar basal-body rod protein FlgG
VYIQNRLGLIEGTETMLVQERRMNQISNNLANVDTSGYKKEDVTFWEVLFKTDAEQLRVGKGVKLLTDQSQGNVDTTGNPLDFAISGEGFFRIQTPTGIAYTRNGNFTLNSEGQLSTMSGNLVLGEGGAITLPTDQVQVGRDGLITAEGEIINQLSLVTFEDLSALQKMGGNLFALQDDTAQEQAVELPSIQQGYLEGSNVNIVGEMTSMIDLQRAYQSQQKIIQTIDEMDAQAISRVGKLTG